MRSANHLFSALVLVGAVFVARSSLATDTTVDPEVLNRACELLVDLYPQQPDDDYDYYGEDLSIFGIKVTADSCSMMASTASNFREKQVGSKSYIVGMDLQLGDDDIQCHLKASRRISVDLDPQDQPLINVGPWQVTDQKRQACYVKADPRLVQVDPESTDNGLLPVDDDLIDGKLYIPDYLELGEVDDGTYGTGQYNYVMIDPDSQHIIGYVIEYWYANSEGQSASKYILKYNSKGVLLGNLIRKDGYDYCDYPFFEEIPKVCTE